MAISRRNIVAENSFVHITWRCLNREFFIKNESIKDYILVVWKKFKAKYGIKIYEFAIMDNHVHLLIKAPNAEKLGDFMRVANSQIARRINKIFKRESHALHERYKSPLITTDSYFVNTMGYIWFNHFRATGKRPEDYIYCSLFYRFRGIKLSLLDNYDDLPIGSLAKKHPQRFVHNLLSEFKARAYTFVPEIFEHVHTIGPAESLKERWAKLKEKIKKPTQSAKQHLRNDKQNR
jgi:REP element-mobilizing transposase RayT